MNFREYILNEMSVERARKIVSGLAYDVNTIGIMTPMNPQAKKAPDASNKLFVSQFVDYLRSNGYDPIEIGGKFSGNEEKSFLIKNISRKQIVELGKMYDQESVIWGQKVYDRNQPHFHYEYIDGGKTTSTSYRLDFDAAAKNPVDNFSTIKNKKFVIPFFSPDGTKH